VAAIDMSTLPVARLQAVLAARLLEARLLGALPIVVPSEASPFEPRVVEGPLLVALGASLRPEWRALPSWPGADAPPQAGTIAHRANGSGAGLDE
jgi:hypothetical protein